MKFALREKATTPKPGPGASSASGRLIGQYETLREAEEAAMERSENHPDLTYEVFEQTKGVVVRYVDGNRVMLSNRPK